jgi:phosphoglycolate phosphatase
MIESYIGDGAAMLVRRALGDPGDLDSKKPGLDDGVFRTTYDFFLGYYRDHKLDNTRCYDGVLEALTRIRASHSRLPMAVLTNKPVNPSREICSALGLEQFFFQNYGGNSFATKKPDPTGLLALIAEASSLLGWSINSEETVMIGDSDVDVLTARRCGCQSLGCSFGLAPVALAAAEPDMLVSHPLEWPVALGL